MKKEYTCYLAGAMEYVVDNGTSWRIDVAGRLAKLGIESFNPASMEHGTLALHGISTPDELAKLKQSPFDFSKFKGCMQSIIKYDMDAIDNLDSMIVYITRGLSGGTIGEITHAFRNLDIPVYGVLEPGLTIQEVSGWVIGCTKEIFSTFDDAVMEVGWDKWLSTKVEVETATREMDKLKALLEKG